MRAATRNTRDHRRKEFDRQEPTLIQSIDVVQFYLGSIAHRELQTT